VLLGVSPRVIRRWWQRVDEAEGKPPHRGGRGQEPVDRAALAEAELAAAREQVKDLARQLAAAREAAGEGPAGLGMRLVMQLAESIEIDISHPGTKLAEKATALRAVMDFTRWQRDQGTVVEDPAAAHWEDLRAGLAAIPRPVMRPCDYGLVEDGPSDVVEAVPSSEPSGHGS
jgi:hypothetical protein